MRTEKKKLPRLAILFIFYIAVACVASIFTYSVLTWSATEISDKVINRTDYFDSYFERAAGGLQALTSEQQLKSDNFWALYQWNKRNDYAYIEVYASDRLIYQTGLSFEEIQLIEPSFHMSSYNSRHVYPLIFSDTQASVVMYLYPDFRFYDWVSIVSIFVSAVLFLTLFLLLVQKKFLYMVYISNTVQKMEHGALSERVRLEGRDEISQLAVSINSLVDTIEKQIRLEEQLKQENMQIIASLSHDIRTPLTSVISYLDFIRSKKYEDPAKLESFVNIAYSNAYQLKALTDDLFEHCLQNAQGEQTNCDVINGKTFLQQMLFEVTSLLEDEGMESIVVNSVEEDFQIAVNPNQFRRIFDNLCSNILKYADRTAPIRIWIEADERFLYFRQDNRIKAGSDSKVDSHGIGLRASEMILKSYHGTMQYSAEECFEIKITLPIQPYRIL